MGLREEITADIAEAFNDDLADAVTEFSAEHREQGEYDPETGSTEVVIPYTGRGVFAAYRDEHIDETLILRGDERLTALQAEVTRTPAVGDIIAGRKVIRVGKDPANVTWSVQVRK